MKTLVICFLLVTSASGALSQTKTTPNIHNHTPLARPFSAVVGQELDPKQALTKAVQDKDLAAVKALLAQGADPNFSVGGDTPLGWAARLNLTDIVKVLLDSGADVNARNNEGRSILISAAEWPFCERNCSYEPTIRVLLDKGADVSIRDKYDMTALLYAAYYRDANVVRLLLDARSDINAKANGSETALMRAIMAHKKETVSLLLDRGADVNDDAGSIAMAIAASKGDTDVVQMLLNKGAKLTTKRELAQTLVQAAQSGNIATVKFFLKDADGESINSALLHCVSDPKRVGNTYEIAKLLLEKGADPNGKEDDGTTVLMNAANGNYCNGDTAGLVRLLIEAGARIHTKNRLGRTALGLAAGCPDLETVQLLLAHGAEVNAKTDDGETALMAAVEGNSTATIVKLLLSKGAEVNAKTSHGRTPLIMAAMQDSYPTFGQSPTKADPAAIFKLLLESGADPGVKEQNGWTAFDWAIHSGNTAALQLLVEKLATGPARQTLLNDSLVTAARFGRAQSVHMLLANGAAINFQDENDDSALLMAALSGDLATVKILIAKGANVNALNKEGRSALMRAVEHRRVGIEAIEQPNQYFDIVKLLLASGADINVVDKQGMTALKLAQQNESADLVKLLLEAAK